MTSPSPVEVLQKARALLEKGWCQGVAARTDKGTSVSPRNRHATSFCVYGSLCCAGYEENMDLHAAIDDIMFGRLEVYSFGAWNDAPGRTQEEVLTLMDRAIDLARQKEAGGDVL